MASMASVVALLSGKSLKLLQMPNGALHVQTCLLAELKRDVERRRPVSTLTGQTLCLFSPLVTMGCELRLFISTLINMTNASSPSVGNTNYKHACNWYFSATCNWERERRRTVSMLTS